MARLIWTTRATAEFEAACEYLADRSEQAVRTFARGIRDVAEDTAANPYHGAEVPEYERRDVRERLYGKYRVIYHAHADEVNVLSVWHSARPLPTDPPI